ncbi:MAG: hypothetical protein IT314_05920 [Anaerolineales bacterium]|nr:hypothetical protein [Anaerolineales bacterium]
MDQVEAHLAAEKLARLKTDFGVSLLADWGSQNENSGGWKPGSWTVVELDRLQDALSLFSNLIGGTERFIANVGKVTVKKADIGSHGGEARLGEVAFSTTNTFSAWTVVHEFAHVWDGNNGWRLSRQLERYTGGFTSRFLSFFRKYFRDADLNDRKRADEPGKRGRKPGCNARGYFYGDKPSGSDWNFNRVEDFAESVAMYVGWGRDNALSDWAQARISRYLRPNREEAKYFGVDTWADYAKYFYPDEGDYAKTKRWQFVDEVVFRRTSRRFS